MSSEGRFSVVFLILYLQATSAIWPSSPPLHMVWLLQAHLQELFALFYIMWFLMFFWDHHNQTNLPQRDSVFVHHCMELFLQRGDGKGLTCEIWDEIALPSSSQSSSSKGVVVMWWDSVRDTISSTTPPATASSDTSPASWLGRKIGNRSERRIFSLAMSNLMNDNVEKICWNISLKLVQVDSLAVKRESILR